MVKKLVDELGLGNVRVSMTLAALAALVGVVVWLAGEMQAIRKLVGRVDKLDNFKARVVEEGWLPVGLAGDVASLKVEMREMRGEMRELRLELARGMAGRVSAGNVGYRIPESSRAAVE